MFNVGGPIVFLIVQKKHLGHHTYFFNYFHRNQHGSAKNGSRFAGIVELTSVFFAKSDGEIAGGYHAKRCKTGKLQHLFRMKVLYPRADHPNLIIRFQQVNQGLQETGFYFCIVVDKQDVFTLAVRQGSVVSTSKAEIMTCFHQRYPGEILFYYLRIVVWRSIIYNKNLVVWIAYLLKGI